MAFENLIISDRGAVRIITLNRPKALNALNSKTLAELGQAIKDIEAHAGIRAVVITGGGEKSFVAGADIVEMKDLRPVDAELFSAKGHAVFDALSALHVPVIAAVNGFALGGGLELALACDFIYASENARLGLVETNLGLIPGFGGLARLSRRVGNAMARELVFSAKQLKAEQALTVGLVNKVVPAGEVVDAAVKTAETIAEKGPVAIRLAKTLLNETADADIRTANAMEQRAFGLVFGTDDKVEGIGAFLEKRRADFTGQ